ncbi:hypothetical protein Tco_1029254 [Tanacetum coccineum]|uniref:Uncharacterized protein n=1 Tax=Tanacetum coccineum TaxID=301880 RepID=A0ABQ5G4G2_9ASTR
MKNKCAGNDTRPQCWLKLITNLGRFGYTVANARIGRTLQQRMEYSVAAYESVCLWEEGSSVKNPEQDASQYFKDKSFSRWKLKRKGEVLAEEVKHSSLEMWNAHTSAQPQQLSNKCFKPIMRRLTRVDEGQRCIRFYVPICHPLVHQPLSQ